MIIKQVKTLESWRIQDIKPYPNNFKIHNPEQILELANIIKEQGFNNPIMVDEDGVIINGHGRRLAAMHLGMTYVPVIIRTDMTPEEKRKARIADNTISRGDFDQDALLRELQDLSSIGASLDNLGFNESEWEEFNSKLASSLGSDEDLGSALQELASDSEEPKEEIKKESKKEKAERLGVLHTTQYQVVIECKNEEDQKVVYDIMTEKGYKAKPLTI